MLSNSASLVGPKLSGLAIDAIGVGQGAADLPKVYYYAVLMALFYAASAVLSYLLSRVIIHLRRNVIYRMRKDVLNRLVSLPVSYFDRRQTGDIISVVSYDIDTVNESLSSDIIQMLHSVITVTVSLIMMLTIAPVLVPVFFITVPASVIFTRYITRRGAPAVQEALSQVRRAQWLHGADDGHTPPPAPTAGRMRWSPCLTSEMTRRWKPTHAPSMRAR